MKKALKVLKWLGITVLGVLLIAAIYLGITGVPKPGSMTTENVPRIPLKYATEVASTANGIDNVMRLLGWYPEEESGLLVRFFSPSGLKLGVIDGSQNQPKELKDWPSLGFTSRMGFPEDHKKGYFLYTQDNSDGAETFQIYKFDLSSQESTLLTNGKDTHIDFKLIPNSDKIIYKKRIIGETNKKLFIKDLNTPEKEELVFEYDEEQYDGTGTIYLDEFSPDGKKMAIRLGYYNIVPAILDLESGELKTLQNDSLPNATYTYHNWSKDGKRIYYASSAGADFSELRFKDLESNKDSVLTKDLHWDVSNIDESPDGKWIVFATNEDGTYKQNIYHVPTGTIKKFDKVAEGSIPYAVFDSKQDATIAFHVEYFSGAVDIFSYNLNSDELKKWTDNKPDVESPPSVIRYPSFDIDTLTNKRREIAAVYYPVTKEIEGPAPVIIELHGGPNSQSKTVWNPLIEFQRAQGVAVIAPNFRGSRGYGFNFMSMDYGEGRTGAIKDIGALIDWIEEQPELDSNKIILSGASYGGFLTLACSATYSDRILGALDLFGMTDLVPFLEEGEKNADRRAEYGDPSDPEMRKYLEELSPINNVDKFDVPLFIFQGEKDSRVRADQSRRLVEVLKAQNKEYWYLESAEAGHDLGGPLTQAYVISAQLTFINELLNKEE